ncbi:MAG: hypothetical protein AAF065_00100 [Verrucomicrobiota bacterium]
MKKAFTLISLCAATASLASAAVVRIEAGVSLPGSPTVSVNGLGNLVIDGDATLNSSDQYILTEITYVTNGTLTIPAGTIIRGEQTTGANNDPGALVITRSAQIDAQGTAANPVIFTTAALDTNSNGLADRVGGNDAITSADFVEFGGGNDENDFLDVDPLNSPLGPYFGWDTADRYTSPLAVLEYRGMWGGLIICGNAPTSISEINGGILTASSLADGVSAPSQIDDPFEGFIEGIAPGVSGELGVYGGRNPHDSSGSLRFVSIRHGGSDIGDGNEINGLTMGAVGAGTRIEFVEVYCNADDGFEWFGGTVNCKNLVAAYNNDDSFDIDEGFSGLGQFLFSLTLDDNTNGNHAAEHDGVDALFESVGVEGLDSEGDNGGGVYLTHTTIYNATYIGAGALQSDAPDSGENTAFRIRDSWGGGYFNSIFTDFGGYALRFDSDAASRYDAGDISFRSNMFYNFAKDGGVEFDATPTALELGRNETRGEGALDNSGTNATNAANFANNTIDVDPFAFRRVGFIGFADPKFDIRSGLDPRPDPSVGAVTANTEPELATFFENVSYKGAFDPTATSLWTDTWTAVGALGILETQL